MLYVNIYAPIDSLALKDYFNILGEISVFAFLPTVRWEDNYHATSCQDTVSLAYVHTHVSVAQQPKQGGDQISLA